jgi:hypothetical protein
MDPIGYISFPGRRAEPLRRIYGADLLLLLPSLVICATPEELRLRANWDGTGTVSRRKLLQEIECESARNAPN